MNLYQNFSPKLKTCADFLTVILLGSLAAAALAFAFSFVVSAFDALSGGEAGERRINAVGEGKVFAKPDVAVFTAGIITQAKNVKDAQNENTIRSNSLLDFMKKQGVADRDLKTIGYSIFPQYQNTKRPCSLIYPPIPCPVGDGEIEIVAYRVIHSLEIKTRDLSKTDELIDGAVSHGANEVGSLYFAIDDENAPKEEARRLAIADAKKKASVLAKDLGVRLGKIVNFSESGFSPVFLRSKAVGVGGAPDEIPTPQVEPGEREIRSTVTIIYEFR